MKRIFITIGMALTAGLLLSCTSVQEPADYRVVPLPQEITLGQGEPFVLDRQVKILYPEGNTDMKRNAEFLAQYVKKIDREGVDSGNWH